MNYSFLKDVIGSPWQVDSQTLNGLLPIFRGILSGLNLDKSQEPQSHKSYQISALKAFRASLNQESTQDLSIEDEHPQEHHQSAKVINILPLRSVLTKHDQECGPRGTRTLGIRLLESDADASVIGHIIIVESGGGQTIAVPEMTDAMIKCTKPIVVWIDGMAASAAYYIACYAKEIIASRPTDIVGCIGTMLVWEGRKNKSPENQLQEVQVTIYSDGSPDKNAEYNAAINDFNFKPAQENLLNPINEKFKADVLSQRPAVNATQLTGNTFTAANVIGTLVDFIGDLDFAIGRILSLANFKEDTSSSSNNQSPNNSKPMVKQFSHVNQLLSVPSLEGSDEGVFLNEDQLQSIEEGLEANQQLVTERDSAIAQRDTATETIGTMQATIDQAQQTAATAFDPFNAIDPTILSAQTPEEKVTAIRTLLAAKPGTTTVQAIGHVEEESSTDVDWETINNLPHNKNVDTNS